MLLTLTLRSLLHRPWRSALLFAGYGIGVAVMVVLLSIGEAMLTQARDEKLVGGGEVTVLPEGLDVEVMKTGGVGGLFFSIANARFVSRQLLGAPRLAGAVRAVAPQIEGKLVYLTLADGRTVPARAAGEIPSATRAVGAAAELASGRWEDDDRDRRWLSPTPVELRHDMDHFHRPPTDRSRTERESWAEWHYFNVLSPDRRRWAFVTLMVAGDVAGGRWGGNVLVTLHEQGAGARRFEMPTRPELVRFSTTDANLAIGGSSVEVTAEGNYAVRAIAREAGTGTPLDARILLRPAPRAYFPGADIGDRTVVSGYAVAALRADADVDLCVGGRCERWTAVQGYHDHNWGLWRNVNWEWGAGRAGGHSLLFGRVQRTDSTTTDQPLFLYLTDSLGFKAIFRPARVAWEDTRALRVEGGRTLMVPSRGTMTDLRGADTLVVELEVEDATATDTRPQLLARGDTAAARALVRPWFIQMKGLIRVRGRVDGAPVAGEGTGFFETYRGEAAGAGR